MSLVTRHVSLATFRQNRITGKRMKKRKFPCHTERFDTNSFSTTKNAKSTKFDREIGFPSPPQNGCPKYRYSLARRVVTKYTKQSLGEATGSSPRLQPWNLISNGHKPRRGGRNVASNLPHPLQTLLSSPMISIAFISSPSLLLKETKPGEFHVPEIIANDSP